MDFGDDNNPFEPFISSANDCYRLDEVTLGSELFTSDHSNYDIDQQGQTPYQNLLAALTTTEDTFNHNSEQPILDGTSNSILSSQPGWYSERTFSTKKKATVVNCEYCGKTLKHPSKIAAHRRTHTGEKPFVCETCNMSFTQRTPLRMHLRRHKGEMNYQCSFGCGKWYVSNSLRNAHEVRSHLGRKRKGPPCPHLKPRKRLVIPHEDTANRANVIILEDKVPADRKRPLNEHEKIDEIIEAVASGVTFTQPAKKTLTSKCPYCDLIMKHPSKIQAHLRIHTNERPYACDMCGMRFKTSHPLKVHIRRLHTGERPFECSWKCGMRFVSIASRNEHVKVVHEGIKRYQCDTGGCRRLFTRRRYFLLHKQKEHGASLEDIGMSLGDFADANLRDDTVKDWNLLLERGENPWTLPQFAVNEEQEDFETGNNSEVENGDILDALSKNIWDTMTGAEKRTENAETETSQLSGQSLEIPQHEAFQNRETACTSVISNSNEQDLPDASPNTVHQITGDLVYINGSLYLHEKSAAIASNFSCVQIMQPLITASPLVFGDSSSPN